MQQHNFPGWLCTSLSWFTWYPIYNLYTAEGGNSCPNTSSICAISPTPWGEGWKLFNKLKYKVLSAGGKTLIWNQLYFCRKGGHCGQ